MTPTQSLPMVDAVRRTLEIDGQPGAGRRRARVILTLTTHISRAPARLWPLLTVPRELEHWLGPVHGDLAEGGSFEAPGGVRGRVLEVESPHRISLTWGRGEAQEPLLVRLDPEDDGTTELTLRRTQLLDADELERSGVGSIALEWEIALLALAAHTDGWRDSCLTAPPVPTPQWLHGPHGTEHVRAWSVRWAAEMLAAGVDETSARRGEVETVRRHLDG